MEMTWIEGVFLEKTRGPVVGVLLGVMGLDRYGQAARFFRAFEKVRIEGKAVLGELTEGGWIFRVIGCEHSRGGGTGDAGLVCVNDGDRGPATMKFEREGETDDACS